MYVLETTEKAKKKGCPPVMYECTCKFEDIAWLAIDVCQCSYLGYAMVGLSKVVEGKSKYLGTVMDLFPEAIAEDIEFNKLVGYEV